MKRSCSRDASSSRRSRRPAPVNPAPAAVSCPASASVAARRGCTIPPCPKLPRRRASAAGPEARVVDARAFMRQLDGTKQSSFPRCQRWVRYVPGPSCGDVRERSSREQQLAPLRRTRWPRICSGTRSGWRGRRGSAPWRGRRPRSSAPRACASSGTAGAACGSACWWGSQDGDLAERTGLKVVVEKRGGIDSSG